tara:strand:- start:820 stop:1104 length:285 start_codon:yes stop_codon:yes gene_type:complete
VKTYAQFNEDLKSWWNKGKTSWEDTASMTDLVKDDVKKIGRIKNKTTGKLTKIPNPVWSFTKGLKTGPTPLTRQMVGRTGKVIMKVAKIASKLR